MTHTFAICAYKESKYLEECIISLKNQTVQTNIILATSTPNDFIKQLCEKYNIPMYVNEGKGGITRDWNFAYKKAETDCVTIAHQDDVYDKHYAEMIMKEMEKRKTPIIVFTDYSELRDDEVVHNNKLLIIKRIMLLPLRIKGWQKSRFVRRRILSMGSPICCPSVTFMKANCPKVVFQHDFRSNEDWQAWERLSRCHGEFVYITKVLTYHRIHEDSETTKILQDSARGQEDYVMFKKFWPKPIAKCLTKLYGTSEKSNDMHTNKK